MHGNPRRPIQRRYGRLLSPRRAIRDDLLNENYKRLAADLDDEQKAKLREMQRAWIAYRDSTCGFYYTKIQGTMAGPMTAACTARETARRAVLLKFFSGL